MIIGFFGDLGSAKTLSMTALMTGINNKHDVDCIVTNYSYEYADKTVSNPRELDRISKEHNGIQGLDEVWAWADSRKSNRNDVFNELIMNSRKRGWIIFYTVQKIHMIDKRLSDNTDYKIMCEHHSGLRHDVGTMHILDDMMRYLNTIDYVADNYYDLYDTDEEVAIKEKTNQYDDMIDKYVDATLDNEFKHKKEIRSHLYMHENISKDDAKMVADEVMRQVRMINDNEETDKEDVQTRLGGNE